MHGVRFTDPQALRAALSLVPAALQAKGGKVRRGDDGSFVVTADLPADVRKALAKAGAEVLGAAGADGGAPFLHWAELVPLEPDRDPDLREALFVLPPEVSWLALAAELIRLGCDELELGWLEDHGGWVVKAHRPSFYTVAHGVGSGGVDSGGIAPWTVFVRQAQAWVTFGWRHPLADRLVVEDGGLLLLAVEGWRNARVAGWTHVAEHLDLLLAPPDAGVPVPDPGRLGVQLRLRPAPRGAPPTLWRVPSGPPGQVDRILSGLVRTLPDAVVDRLELARFTLPSADGPVDAALIRARPGSDVPSIEGISPFVAHAQLGTLFLPYGRAIDPPLRSRTLATLLDPGPGKIGWLEPGGDGEDRVVSRTLDERAFRPLADHVVYLADRDGDAVDLWLGSTRFDWEPLDIEVARDEPGTRRREVEEVPEPARRRAPIGAAPLTPPPVVASASEHRVVVVPLVGTPIPDAVGAEAELLSLEGTYTASASPDTPERERVDLWVPMAELNHALGRHREAALCWTRAMWEAGPDTRRALAERWASVAMPSPPAELPAAPTPVELAAVTAAVLAGTGRWDPRDVQRFLDAHDRALDVRSRWLARRAVAERSGRDELALARARDVVLGAIRTGLVPARDVPSFLRSSTTPEQRRQLAVSLDQVWQALDLRVPATAPVACTRAYGRLTIAWAQACLGLAEPVHEALAAATAALPTNDPVHVVLLALYRSGIEETLAGLPAETPPPPDALEALAKLPKLDRFKVDRLRAQSIAVLAETGTADPFTSFVQKEELAPLGDLPPEELLAAVRRTIAERGDEPTRALLRALNAATSLHEADAADIFAQVCAIAVETPPEARVTVLVEAATIAAALRRPEPIRASLSSLQEGLVARLQADPNTVVEPVRSLSRSLVRCQLGAEAATLFTSVRDACPPSAPVVRLRLMGALAQVGADVGDEISRGLALLETSLQPNQRMAAVAAVADLATPLPIERAAPIWMALVPYAPPDPYSTNTHYALSFLKVTEILAAAHVHPDRMLGGAGRARIDHDEHRVRMRIHREDRF